MPSANYCDSVWQSHPLFHKRFRHQRPQQSRDEKLKDFSACSQKSHNFQRHVNASTGRSFGKKNRSVATSSVIPEKIGRRAVGDSLRVKFSVFGNSS